MCRCPDAALHSLREIGPALLITTCVFVGGNAVVMLSYIPALRMFAWLSCVSLIRSFGWHINSVGDV